MSVEKHLIDNCSPTLASIKAANLFTISCDDDEELARQMAYWNFQLRDKGIRLFLLRRSETAALIYVCRMERLQAALRNPEVMAFLKTYGYEDFSVDAAIALLAMRIQENDGFPHEIGIFLDYPLEDVIGFIENQGKNYRCSGCWKVYGDACKAQKTFDRYKKCRSIYTRLWNQGRSVEQLTVAV